jgi:hypothetical protein
MHEPPSLSALADTTFAIAPNALSDLKNKLKGLFKGKKSTTPADKPAEPAAATATEVEAPTATKDAAEATPAPAGKNHHVSWQFACRPC